MSIFKDKALLITGGTGSFGNMVLKRFLGISSGKFVLFSDVSHTPIKRSDIAKSIIEQLGSDYTILPMYGTRPEKVSYYINAFEFETLTSDKEGSTNIIRECLALNKFFSKRG